MIAALDVPTGTEPPVKLSPRDESRPPQPAIISASRGESIMGDSLDANRFIPPPPVDLVKRTCTSLQPSDSTVGYSKLLRQRGPARLLDERIRLFIGAAIDEKLGAKQVYLLPL